MDRQIYRERRKALGLTQHELAKRLGLGRDAIGDREAGRTRLTVEHWLALDALKTEES